MTIDHINNKLFKENERELCLKELQDEEYNLLVKFSDYCESHNLSYFLAYGSLLGAVRHAGPIPWDDDLDIVMPRGDYDKLLRLAPVLDGCRLLKPGMDGFPWMFAKFVSDSVGFREPVIHHLPEYGAYIDVFPIDPCPESGGAIAVFRSHLIQKLRNYAYVLDWSWEPNRRGVKGKVKWLLGALCRVVPQLTWDNWVEKSVSREDWESCKYVCCYFTPYGIEKERMLKSDCEGFSRVAYKNSEFRTFRDPIRALERVYGTEWRTPIKQDEHIHGYAYRRN